MRRVGRLIVMGGAVEAPGNVTAAAEFNFHVDPVAADRVLASGMRITLVALDVTRRVRLHWAAVRDALRGDRSALARALRHFTRAWSSSEAGMPLHDPLATALAIDPGLARTHPLPVRVETKGVHTRGMSVADRRPHRAAPRRSGGNAAETGASIVDVAFEVDARGVLDLVAERVFGAARPLERRMDVVVVGGRQHRSDRRRAHAAPTRRDGGRGVPAHRVRGQGSEPGGGGAPRRRRGRIRRPNGRRRARRALSRSPARRGDRYRRGRPRPPARRPVWR